MTTTFDFNQSMTKKRRGAFAQYLLDLQALIDFKVSSRGWCYILEGERAINKDQFSKVEKWINKCRRTGDLPIDFTATDESRNFSGVEDPENISPVEYMGQYLDAVLDCGQWYTPDWWQGEEYYIQIVVEKIDLKTLFEPVCQRYHIPIANSKGWSSMEQRAEYARRFKEAEQNGLQPALLYCGDYDPDGIRISDTLFKNLKDLQDIVWDDGETGYDPAGLIINRFGLNYDFIELHQLTWIDNLITGGNKNLASPKHKNHYLDYVQSYLESIGARKCEANAIVTMPQVARDLVESVILSYLGDDVLSRFEAKRQAIRDEIAQFQSETGLRETIQKALEAIK